MISPSSPYDIDPDDAGEHLRATADNCCPAEETPVAIVVVTGSASGIGAATADRLATRGNHVIGVDIRDADIVADLSDPAARRSAIESIASMSGGRLEGVVTCAGVAALPDRASRLLVSVNYFGTVELLSGLRPLLAASDGAAAVAISSNSTTCQPGVPADLVEACLAGDEPAALDRAGDFESLAGVYPATKIAIARWVRARAVTREWVGAGIRLNAVAPGMIETPMVEESRRDETVGPLLDLFPIPMGRSGRPEEIAAVIDFLLGPDSSLLCGSIVFADGGTDALLRRDDWPSPWELDVTAAAESFVGDA
jgi:NAD(P)-dependent dehydrogenase (short-subunit alcohol dehydrogenase family)